MPDGSIRAITLTDGTHLDLKKRRAYKKRQTNWPLFVMRDEILFTRQEWAILTYLASGEILPPTGNPATFRVWINRLRSKLGSKMIENRHGLGYMLLVN